MCINITRTELENFEHVNAELNKFASVLTSYLGENFPKWKRLEFILSNKPLSYCTLKDDTITYIVAKTMFGEDNISLTIPLKLVLNGEWKTYVDSIVNEKIKNNKLDVKKSIEEIIEHYKKELDRIENEITELNS